MVLTSMHSLQLEFVIFTHQLFYWFFRLCHWSHLVALILQLASSWSWRRLPSYKLSFQSLDYLKTFELICERHLEMWRRVSFWNLIFVKLLCVVPQPPYWNAFGKLCRPSMPLSTYYKWSYSQWAHRTALIVAVLTKAKPLFQTLVSFWFWVSGQQA